MSPCLGPYRAMRLADRAQAAPEPRVAADPVLCCKALAPLLMMRRRPPHDIGPHPARERRRAHASRYSQSLLHLARQGRHGRRHGRPGRQLRDLGHRRHFPRLRPLDGRQGRRHRNHDRAVPAVLQRPAAAAQPPARPADHADQARALGLDRQIARPADRRGRRSTSRRADCGSASPTPRSPSASPTIRASRAPNGQFDRSALRADDPQRRLHRGALRRRAAAT